VSEHGPSGEASEVLHPGDEHEHPESSAIPYVAVWIALLFFTFLTYFTGKQHYAHGALAIALVIACTKSTLVALIFMHLNHSSGTTRLVFGTALIFVALLLLFTVGDVATRFTPATPKGAPFGTERSQPEGLLEHELPE
jgi:cytochrome c oxidase subunit 4